VLEGARRLPSVGVQAKEGEGAAVAACHRQQSRRRRSRTGQDVPVGYTPWPGAGSRESCKGGEAGTTDSFWSSEAGCSR
jgi:hypothetical protein